MCADNNQHTTLHREPDHHSHVSTENQTVTLTSAYYTTQRTRPSLSRQHTALHREPDRHSHVTLTSAYCTTQRTRPSLSRQHTALHREPDRHSHVSILHYTENQTITLTSHCHYYLHHINQNVTVTVIDSTASSDIHITRYHRAELLL